jgi:ATPase family associated with various cellular activities (AAA)
MFGARFLFPHRVRFALHFRYCSMFLSLTRTHPHATHMPTCTQESVLEMATTVAEQCSGFVAGDMQAVVCEAVHHRRAQHIPRSPTLVGRSRGISRSGTTSVGVPSLRESLLSAVRTIREYLSSQAIGGAMATVPDVRWQDIGGLESARRELMDTVELPLKHASLLFDAHAEGGSLRARSGVLLYGPPGTGKTLLAKVCSFLCEVWFLLRSLCVSLSSYFFFFVIDLFIYMCIFLFLLVMVVVAFVVSLLVAVVVVAAAAVSMCVFLFRHLFMLAL